MINTLHIKNIGIIDDLTLNLNEGFNVLTGETGAGKTLIIGSLQILTGGRFSKEMIRTGEKNSFVEMSISVENSEYEDNTIIVSREININGRNTCKINGRLVTVTELKEFMKKIIDIHGQNENQSVLDLTTHIELLDEYSKEGIKVLKMNYKNAYEKYQQLKTELNKNYGDDKEKQRTLDLLNYQVNEIEDAKLKIGEEEELEEKRKLILSSEKISSNLCEAENQISNSTIDSLNVAIKSLEKIEEYNDKYATILSRLRTSYYEIEEASRDISCLNEDIYFDEEEQNQIEERLELINSLKRKYGNNIKEILDYKEQINNQIFEIKNLEDYIQNLKKQKKEIEEVMYDISLKMHEIRLKFAKELSKKINNELADLEMKNAKFSIKVEFNNENSFNSNGLDEVEFLISTNFGEEAKSLIKIASGGEMSRIMLAIKTVLADEDKIPIIIFDEIDTGISGVAANSTGEKMKIISKKHQVICVTHLASIAAQGDYNYFVYKEIDGDKTKTKVKQLNEDETIKEIARISSGKISEISISHAKELRKSKIA